jgi:mRNA interferase RelE/StbE
MKGVSIEKPARKALQRMQRPTAARIVEKLEQYASDPESLSKQVRSLAGDHRKRLRVGDWRVLFIEDAATITVLDIRARGSAYKE